MGGFDDNAVVMGDWMIPSPSSRAFFSSMSDDVIGWSIVDTGTEDKGGPSFPWPNGYGKSGNIDQMNQTRASADVDESSSSNEVAEPKTSYRGGLLERMAARAGFNAPRLNTESIRPPDLFKNSEVQSPLFTIPPGFSPTCLLDSPVFLSNSSVLPSPTTGKFSFAPNKSHPNSALATDGSDNSMENNFEEVDASPFALKPAAESSSLPYFNVVNKVNPSSFNPRAFPTVNVSVNSSALNLRQNRESQKFHLQQNGVLFQQANMSKPDLEINKGNNLSLEYSPALEAPNEEDGDRRNNGDTNVGGTPDEDGYNWKKYGQKQVKGSDYPRSYYKCTYSNCPVKKKVERSQEGHITEIIYKGAHNHPKPPSNSRSTLGCSNARNKMQLDSEQLSIGANGDPAWPTMQKGNASEVHDWRQKSLEAKSSLALSQEYRNGATNLQTQNRTTVESGDGVDGSSTFLNDDDDDDRATHGSVSLGYDGEGDESESKRRRIESYASDMNVASRSIREPRVVVQTTSEVDILDDGYHWRKYGQKVVKGNPNPRSYYKCTSTGCNVRKHVERASHDLKSVITTYEGKHNHDVPTARNSSHTNSGCSNSLSTQRATTAALSQLHRPEPSQVRGNSMTMFERNSIGSFCFPGVPQLGRSSGLGYGMNQPSLAGLGTAGFGPGQRILPALPVHPYLVHQWHPRNDTTTVMVPKEEPKVEPVTDSCLYLSTCDSSMYQQLMSRMPPGPQT